MSVDFYHGLYRATARMILEALDEAMRGGKTEHVDYGSKLTIEHLMPREWEKHWQTQAMANDPVAVYQARQRRGALIHRVGNLTLVTRRLNPSLSNGPWDKKRREILKHSALNLNRVFEDFPEWNEEAIERRTAELYHMAQRIWKHPGRPATTDASSVPVLEDEPVSPQEPPANHPVDGRPVSPHASFWRDVTERFNALRLSVGGSEFEVRQRRPWHYLQVPVGSSYVHYEWEVRKRSRQVDVALHFEHGNLKQNTRFLDALQKEAAVIGSGLPWPFEAEPWGVRWALARYPVPYSGDRPGVKEAPVVVEAMKTLIERTWPTINPLLRGR
jgi:hypothetical protein